jgi:pimeloyl-ACP methyl ester carboxylesterase
MSVVLINSKIVHYEVLGRGRPVFFLHGWVGSWRYWMPAMQPSSTSFRTYALDFWGFGDTTKDPLEYHLDRQVELINEFFNQMGILRSAIIAHGMGAMIALLFANKYPEVVDRLMLVSCPLDVHAFSGRLRSASQMELADWLLGRLPLMEPVRTDAPKVDPLVVSSTLGDLETVDLKTLWVKLTRPCLLVFGRNDPLFSLTSPVLEDLPEMAHAVQFDQSGHFPMLDESSKFNRLQADFLSLPAGDSPRQLQLKEEWKRRVR